MRKGQAAMEYLMTYGWAILIVIVVVAALYAMGVFRIGGKVPCSPCFSYFAYKDHNSTHLYITNGAREINITAATSDGTLATSPTFPVTLAPGTSQWIVFSSIADGAKIEITYFDIETTITRTDSATLYKV